MTGSLAGASSADFEIVNDRPLNVATRSQPCVIHANGWEKLPLIDLVRRTGEITQAQQDDLLRTKEEFDKKKVITPFVLWRLVRRSL